MKTKIAFFRDSVVQRFEYTVEAGWKYLKVLLEEAGGEDLTSPKKVAQAAYSEHYISSLEGWYEMLTARNITSHDYGIHHSESVYGSIELYISYLKEIYDKSLG